MTSPQRGGKEVQKMFKWGDCQGKTDGAIRGGTGSKNLKIGVTSLMDDPLSQNKS